MSERLKAWCHWKRKENHVSEDDLLMVRDIEALIAVAEAAHANQQHIAAMPWNIDDAYDPHSTCVDRRMFNNWCVGTSTQLDLALKELEAVE